ncbi:hypothetical protein Cni_G18504 [Canna indica]|uniref:Bromo domain-containing protein n=1 Tax=Canna indica TaxID=4628 RepID=A0AAQ3QHM8_9LILI|nr:hypothetical protein Cni_G18504 [Canna indica]
MGNRGRAAVDAGKRKKKKGRPSLLDLQKRNLRLQSQQQQQQHPQDNSRPNPNPHPKFPQSTTASRRVTRRNPNPPQGDPATPPPRPDHDDEDEGGSSGKRKEKKLNLVLRVPSPSTGSGSDSDGPERKRRKSSLGDRDKKADRNNSPKATDSVPGEQQADLGLTTHLPDKKLLVFILDRLQKKDTYGVFSEPVDPEELPDYHDIIEHPMDFGTVRMKLLNGEYGNLEQFENDVFLISSNAMRYNAPDTIYFRQARSIHELAKKNFENLRQESDDNEPEIKTVVRRGRPPNKNKKLGRPLGDRAALDSDATLANAGTTTYRSNIAHDMSRNGSSGDGPSFPDTTNRVSHGLHSTDTFGWTSEQKTDRDEEYSGTALKGIPRYGRKPTGIDENRRNTYKQSMLTDAHVSPIFTIFNGEKKQLVPVALHLEYAYARSLARFAAKLGPIGWVVAAKKIQRVLPPGTKFGPGWVVDDGALQRSQPPLVSTSSHFLTKPTISTCTTSRADKCSAGQEISQNNSFVEGHSNRTAPPASSSAAPCNSNFSDSTLPARAPNNENGLNTLVSGAADSDTSRPKTPLQLHQNPGMPRIVDGFNSPFNANMVSQIGMMMRPPGILSGPFGSGAQIKIAEVTNAQALDIFSRANSNNFIHQTAGRPTYVDSPSMINSSCPLPAPSNDSNGPCQGTILQPKSDSVPPDLNVGFHSPGSPASGVAVDSQQPDLALQL